MYNGTHGDTCYYVNCSLGCTLEFFNWSCPSTPSPTPSPSTPTTHERSTSSTPPSRVPGCPDLDPPRQVCVCGGFCPLWHLNPTCCLPVGHAPASVPHTSPSGQGFRQPAGRRVCGGRPAFSPWLAALLDRVALGFQPPGQGLASMAQPSRVGQAGRAHPASFPPPQENESWWMCNCTRATCRYNNTVELVKVKCEPPPMPTCTNGLAPVRVEDPDKCCWHWECDCKPDARAPPPAPRGAADPRRSCWLWWLGARGVRPPSGAVSPASCWLLLSARVQERAGLAWWRVATTESGAQRRRRD